jgi:hypothetical protein
VSNGRCAGCRRSGELKSIRWHVVICPEWARLYRDDPAAALDPEAEFERWRRADRPAERDADLQVRIADTEARRERSVARFRRTDPLED